MAKDKEIMEQMSVREKIADLKSKVADLEKGLEEKIESHPVKSVAIALGIGIVAGALIATLMRKK